MTLVKAHGRVWFEFFRNHTKLVMLITSYAIGFAGPIRSLHKIRKYSRGLFDNYRDAFLWHS